MTAPINIEPTLIFLKTIFLMLTFFNPCVRIDINPLLSAINMIFGQRKQFVQFLSLHQDEVV